MNTQEDGTIIPVDMGMFGPKVTRSPYKQELRFEDSVKSNIAIDRKQIPEKFVVRTAQPFASSFSSLLKSAFAQSVKAIPEATKKAGGAKIVCRRLRVVYHFEVVSVGGHAVHEFILVACDFGNNTAHYTIASQLNLFLAPADPAHSLSRVVARHGIEGLKLVMHRNAYAEPFAGESATGDRQGLMKRFASGVSSGPIESADTISFCNRVTEDALAVKAHLCKLKWVSKDTLVILGHSDAVPPLEVKDPKRSAAPKGGALADDSDSDDVEWGHRKLRRHRVRAAGRPKRPRPGPEPGPAVGAAPLEADDELPSRGVVFGDAEGFEDHPVNGFMEGELEELLGGVIDELAGAGRSEPSVDLPSPAGPPALHPGLADAHPGVDASDEEIGGSDNAGSGSDSGDDPSPAAAARGPAPSLVLPDHPALDASLCMSNFASMLADIDHHLEYVTSAHQRWLKKDGTRHLLLGTEKLVGTGSIKCVCNKHTQCGLLVYGLNLWDEVQVEIDRWWCLSACLSASTEAGEYHKACAAVGVSRIRAMRRHDREIEKRKKRAGAGAAG